MAPVVRVPPGLHELEVEKFAAVDPVNQAVLPDPILAEAASAIRSARLSAERVAELSKALAADGTLTDAARALQLRKHALAAANRIAPTLDGTLERSRANFARLEAETAAPPLPRDPVAATLETEARTVLRGMSPTERRAAITNAIASGDDAVVGAVLRGSPMLSGMNAAELEAMRLQWRHARHPAETARLERLQRALETARDRAGLFVSFIARCSDTPEAKAAAAQADRTAALTADT